MQSQWADWARPSTQIQQNSGLDVQQDAALDLRYDSFQTYADYPQYWHNSLDSYQSHPHQQHLVHHQQMSRTTESKPRLSKEEVEILEAEFQKNHKPNSSTKKGLAESMRVDNARINNWFQNRRAREKKENNIRQYEARQKLEKEQGEPEPRSRLNLVESRGLVPSSAPFPNSMNSTSGEYQGAPISSGSETEDGQSDDGASTGYSTGALSATPAQTNVKTEAIYTPSSVDPSLPGSDRLRLDQSQGFLRPDDSDEPTPSLSSLGFSNHGAFNTIGDPHSGSDQELDFLSQSSPTENSARSPSFEVDMDVTSPPTADIASRRNRRPPPLSIGGSRSYNGAGPQTAIDHGRRADSGREMRRVASAHGGMRISKPVTTPRSPFHDRRTENLFHLNRSPVMTGVKSNAAPPTPDTPILAQQPGQSDGQLSAGAKVYNAGFVAHDPTLRTPPTTPGIGDTFFGLNSAYSMPISDQPLVTPGLNSYSTDFEMAGLPLAGSTYMSSEAGCSDQSSISGFSGGMGPSYFGFSGGNAEYNWSGATGSGRSSPGQSAQSVQFMNMTTSNFNR